MVKNFIKILNLALILLFANQILSMEPEAGSISKGSISSELTFGKLPAEIFVKIVQELKNQNTAKEILCSIVKFAGICSGNRQFIKAYLPELLHQILDIDKKITLKEVLAIGKIPELVLEGLRAYLTENLSKKSENGQLKEIEELKTQLFSLKEDITGSNHDCYYKISKRAQFAQSDKNRLINIQKLGLLKSKELNEMLIHAISFNHVDLAEFLITLGADVNYSADDYVGNRLNELVPLAIAIKNRNFLMVQLLLKKGANFNYGERLRRSYISVTQIIYKDTILMKAIKVQHIPITRLLLDEGADLNVINADGYTALSLAVELNNKKILQMLLDSGANIDLKNDALIQAIFSNNIELIDYLLKRGADINFVDEIGLTPLMHAAENNLKEVVLFLLKNGAGINIRNNEAKTAVEIALEKNHLEIAQIILNYQLSQLENQSVQIGQVVQDIHEIYFGKNN